MGGLFGWLSWALLAVFFLAGMLSLFRAAGYRLARRPRRGATGAGTGAVGPQPDLPPPSERTRLDHSSHGLHYLSETGQAPHPQFLDAIQTAPHPVADLREGQPLQVPEDKHFPVILREFCQGVRQQDRLFAANRLLAG